MNADERRLLDGLTERVIGAVFAVSNDLEAGFLEKVNERALVLELRLVGLRVTPQASSPMMYKGQCVGQHYADLVVEDSIVVELKCVEHLVNEHAAQCVNYLRASGMTVCLLVNFQRPRVEWKRIVCGFGVEVG